ncbi:MULTISPECIES: hypothetical protein [unclassified Myroides]|uniref:hypothetical protein n=1 Tax=unclassified Myroides TaxID=2642485 RepID=UPI0015F7E2DC|nr:MULTISPECIES: hypothetical protein [unclassified Myroides]MBB1150574.1 hypothetical protein [Myroides sp. NP-2]MDM1407195.1 hypothetical protein [Myroides sp. DF42-4-2]
MDSYIELDGEKERNGEKLDFLTPGFIFDMKVTQEKLVLTKYSGETLQFKRSTKMLDEVEYPAISVSDKKALNSTSWRLEKIQAFTGEHRSFDQGEHVIYSFGSDGVFVIKNATAVEDNTFERFLKPRTLSYSYRYDFALENREILYINDLGGYRILFTNDELRLVQNDGYLLTFTKA